MLTLSELTSPHASAALAIMQLTGEPAELFEVLGIAPVELHKVALRTVADIDTLLVARPAQDTVLLFPHASPAIRAALLERFEAHSITPITHTDPRALYPEAQSLIEARMLGVLARAASPLAVDLLLAQPALWSEAGEVDETAPEVLERSRVLNRLIDPPTVLALGPSNVGKSTLLNTLAGRAVAVTADVAGTTRDHVGATLDLAGLVVRYIDAPGLSVEATDMIDEQAQAIARSLVPSADLVLLCCDPRTPPLDAASLDIPTGTPTLTVQLRSDLSGPARTAQDMLAVSAHAGSNIGALVMRIRDALVPPELLAAPAPWCFWAGDAADSG